jgi:hypothetical protein
MVQMEELRDSIGKDYRLKEWMMVSESQVRESAHLFVGWVEEVPVVDGKVALE